MPRLAYSEFEKRLWAATTKARLPLSGAFELTYRCNFHCVHCYQQDSREQPELSAARWCELVDEAARAGCLWLTLTGGEALLHPGFEAIYRRAIRSGLLVTLFSNGSTLTDKVVRALRRLPPRTIEVSLYGFSPKTYARTTGRAANFRRAVDGVRRAVDAGLAVHLKTMIFDQTVDDFDAMQAFAREVGQSFRFDTTVHSTLGRSKVGAGRRLAPERIVALEASQPEVVASLRARTGQALKGDRVFQCGAGRFAFTIAPDGAMQSCSLLRSPRFDLARVPFAQAWSALGEEAQRSYQSASRCSGCTLRAVCSTCPGIAAVEQGDTEAPVNHLCDLAHLKAGHLLDGPAAKRAERAAARGS